METTTRAVGLPAGRAGFSGWRLMFRLAALFNVGVAIPLWVAPVALSQALGFAPVPSEFLYTDMFAVLVLAFGIGYWLIGADPVRYRVMVEMGILGKLLVVGVGYQHFIAGTTTWPMAALVTADLLWAFFFWRFLRLHPEQDRGMA